jgi:hypothetical protein
MAVRFADLYDAAAEEWRTPPRPAISSVPISESSSESLWIGSARHAPKVFEYQEICTH